MRRALPLRAGGFSSRNRSASYFKPFSHARLFCVVASVQSSVRTIFLDVEAPCGLDYGNRRSNPLMTNLEAAVSEAPSRCPTSSQAMIVSRPDTCSPPCVGRQRRCRHRNSLEEASGRA